MKRSLYLILSIFLGIFLAQIISTLFVYLSNVGIYREITSVIQAGYFPVPNLIILSTIKGFAPAFWGGLFFTFTIGIGIIVSTLISVWIYSRSFFRGRICLIILLVFWVSFILLMNIRGISPIVTLYILLIPALLFSPLLKALSGEKVKNFNKTVIYKYIIFLLPILLLAGIWKVQLDNYTPLHIKTHVNTSQKNKWTCNLSKIKNHPFYSQLSEILKRFDYLELDNFRDADLTVKIIGDNLKFLNRDKILLETKYKNFISQPDHFLDEYSNKLEKYLFSLKIGNLFISIRDNILLTSGPGIAFSNFYYKYTLYPAEAFKNISQKTIKTCNLAKIKNNPSYSQLSGILTNFDYIEINDFPNTDLIINITGDRIKFSSRNRVIIETKIKKFISEPGQILNEFSKKSDHYFFFRKIIFYSLLFGLPIFIYLICFSIIQLIIRIFCNDLISHIITACICFSAGALLAVPVFTGQEKEIKTDNINQYLVSSDWKHRVQAIKVILNNKLEISDFPAYRNMLNSPLIPERYWLVRSLSESRNNRTYEELKTFLNDTSPIVQCQTLYSIGRRKKRTGINIIKEFINNSDTWYCQWYGYRALKSLGWRQKKL